MKELEDTFGAFLATACGGYFKYVKSRSMLLRRMPSGFQAITVGLIKRADSGSVKVSLQAHIRIEAIEREYVEFIPHISTSERKVHSTLVVNCDYLYRDKTLIDSIQIDSSNLQLIAEKYAEAIDLDIKPFLREFSSLEILVASLEDEDPRCRITSNPSTRYWVLLSFYAANHRAAEFDSLSTEYFEHCAKPAFQAHAPVAESLVHGLRARYFL